MRFPSPSLQALAALLLGWSALRLLRAPEDDTGPGAVAGAPPRWSFRLFALAGAALLVLGGLGVGGWSYLQTQEREEVAKALTGGEPRRAPELITRYGCGGCHTIPGVPGADGKMAGPLTDMRARVYVGGVVRNTADDLIAWIVDPRSLSPRTAMPATGITEQEARDVAAYLYMR